MNNYACRFLCLGVPFRFSITYPHYLEQTFGCNHRYNKVFKTKVLRDGKEVPGPWLAYVRYISIASEPDLTGIEESLRDAGALREIEFMGKPFQSVDIADVNRIGYAKLESNSCAFVSSDVEVVLDEAISMTDAGPTAYFTRAPSRVN
ncbi:MAG: hypothetical protein IIC03_09590 [Proteobacteria bacterium]|nr:hypothetical protein [Pseudomonadota bacterium]